MLRSHRYWCREPTTDRITTQVSSGAVPPPPPPSLLALSCAPVYGPVLRKRLRSADSPTLFFSPQTQDALLRASIVAPPKFRLVPRTPTRPVPEDVDSIYSPSWFSPTCLFTRSRVSLLVSLFCIVMFAEPGLSVESQSPRIPRVQLEFPRDNGPSECSVSFLAMRSSILIFVIGASVSVSVRLDDL